MTVQTSEQTTVAAPACHGHPSAAGETQEAQALPTNGYRERGVGAAALGTVLALPRPVRIIGAAGIGIGALLAVGVPLATLTPLLAVGGCLSMHLFMGHDMNHGGGHGSPGTAGGAAGAGPADDTSTRSDGR